METPDELSRLPSMREIEPSPVEEDTPDATRSYFPVEDDGQPKSTNGSSTLGISGHSAVWYLSRIQQYSTYAFSIFATFHIANTSIIPLVTQSVPASEPYLLLTRPYYQSPVAEPLVILIPLAAHITSGLALRIYRRRQNVRMYGAEDRNDRRKIPWPKVSGSSKLGYLLIPLIVGHSYLNRILPKDSSSINLSYVSHAFAKHPAVSFAGFTALITVGVWHSVWGWAKWLGLTPQQVTLGGEEGRIRRKKRWYLVNAVSAIGAGLWMAGGLGVVGRGGQVSGWVGREYDEIYRSMPILGKYA